MTDTKSTDFMNPIVDEQKLIFFYLLEPKINIINSVLTDWTPQEFTKLAVAFIPH